MAFYCCLMFTRKTQLHACIEFRLFGKNNTNGIKTLYLNIKKEKKMNVNLLEVEFENQKILLFYRSGETIISVYLLSSTEINDTFITRTKYYSFTSIVHAGKF